MQTFCLFILDQSVFFPPVLFPCVPVVAHLLEASLWNNETFHSKVSLCTYLSLKKGKEMRLERWRNVCFIWYVAVIWGSGKICNQLPSASAVPQQTKAARRLEVSDPNMASCLLFPETDGILCLHTGLHRVYVTEVTKPSMLLHDRTGLQLINRFFSSAYLQPFSFSIRPQVSSLSFTVHDLFVPQWTALEGVVGLWRLASTVCSPLTDLYPVNNPTNPQQPLWSL